MPELKRVWEAAWHQIGATQHEASDSVYDSLIEAYNQPHRKYHTVQHITECLDLLVKVAHLAEHPDEIAVALWFHDIAYDPKSRKNEEKSAKLAATAMNRAKIPVNSRTRIAGLIMVTKHDREPMTSDEKLILDIDLAILGAAKRRYNQYERQIAAEYSHVPAEVFKEKRKEFMLAFVSRPHIYHTPYFHKKYERRARANVLRTWVDVK